MYQGKMADFDVEDWIEEVGQIDPDYQRINRALDDAQLLGSWTSNSTYKMHNLSDTD